MTAWLRTFYCLLFVFSVLPNGKLQAAIDSFVADLPPSFSFAQDNNLVKECQNQRFISFKKNNLIKPRVKFRTRFKIPESGFRLDFRNAYTAEAIIAALLISTIAAYRQPYYLSQQYAYLFRLTPF